MPCTTVWLAGDAPNAKLAGGLTTNETVAVWDRLPFTPVIVSVNVPVGVVASVVMFSVEVAVAGFVVNVPVAPVGNPDTLNVTGLLNPPVGVMAIA